MPRTLRKGAGYLWWGKPVDSLTREELIDALVTVSDLYKRTLTTQVQDLQVLGDMQAALKEQKGGAMKARWRRQLEFTAGFQSKVFHACEAHKDKLERGTELFFVGKGSVLVKLDTDLDDNVCDFCQEK